MAKVKETAQVISQEQLSDGIFSMWIHTEAIALISSVIQNAFHTPTAPQIRLKIKAAGIMITT